MRIFKKPDGLNEIIHSHAKTQKLIALAIAIPTAITQAAMWINGYTPDFDPRDNLICFAIYGGCAKLYNDARKAEQMQDNEYQLLKEEAERSALDIEE